MERIINKNIRDDFYKVIENLYPFEKAHDLRHALDVEARAVRVWQIARQEAELRGEHLVVNLLVLRLAALAHDIGYAAEEKMLTSDRFKHQVEGMKKVNQILSDEQLFPLGRKEKIGVALLVFNHDNTAYSYPSQTRNGRPFLTRNQILQRDAVVAQQGLLLELMILREADSFFGTGEVGLRRVLEVATRKELPFFAEEGNPLQAEMWERSVVGNLRLAARRAFEDAFTQKGKKLAIDGWRVYEEEILQRCRREGIEYSPDPALLEATKVLFGGRLINQFS